MTQEEFKILSRGTILLRNNEVFEILDFNEDKTQCNGIVHKKDEHKSTLFVESVYFSELNFFNIDEKEFITRHVRQGIHVECDFINDEGTAADYAIYDDDFGVDVTCRNGLVKYLSRPKLAVYVAQHLIN